MTVQPVLSFSPSFYSKSIFDTALAKKVCLLNGSIDDFRAYLHKTSQPLIDELKAQGYPLHITRAENRDGNVVFFLEFASPKGDPKGELKVMREYFYTPGEGFNPRTIPDDLLDYAVNKRNAMLWGGIDPYKLNFDAIYNQRQQEAEKTGALLPSQEEYRQALLDTILNSGTRAKQAERNFILSKIIINPQEF